MKPQEASFNNARSYEGYVGRWSRPVAHQFVPWLNLPSGLAWLDVGAGTGILTEVILQTGSPVRVLAVDLSQDYLDFARQRIHDERVEFRVVNASDLSYESPEFDVSVAGLVLNFVPDAQQTVNHMAEAVKKGGTVGAYVWDYGGKMEMMRHFWDAAGAVDPVAREMDAGQRFPICDPNNLRAALEAAGLGAVDVTALDVETRFADFDDYWLPFLGAQGSVSKYLHSITDDTRTAIRDQLQKQLPTADDGTIPLVARAWAAKGRKQG